MKRRRVNRQTDNGRPAAIVHNTPVPSLRYGNVPLTPSCSTPSVDGGEGWALHVPMSDEFQIYTSEIDEISIPDRNHRQRRWKARRRLTALPALAFTNRKPERAIITPLMTGVFLRSEKPRLLPAGLFSPLITGRCRKVRSPSEVFFWRWRKMHRRNNREFRRCLRSCEQYARAIPGRLFSVPTKLRPMVRRKAPPLRRGFFFAGAVCAQWLHKSA
jgi:hypothetical protein